MNSESPVLRPLSAILREIGIDSVHSENIRTLHSELVAILESIPVEHRIRSTEGGGPRKPASQPGCFGGQNAKCSALCPSSTSPISRC